MTLLPTWSVLGYRVGEVAALHTKNHYETSDDSSNVARDTITHAIESVTGVTNIGNEDMH